MIEGKKKGEKGMRRTDATRIKKEGEGVTFIGLGHYSSGAHGYPKIRRKKR